MARVLVVDDETVSRVVLRHLLQGAGHEVLEASDGDEAARLFDDEGADVVISDQEMPEMTGLELRRHLGERLTGPFVLLTGYATAEEFPADALAGVDAFLTKPVSSLAMAELFDRLGI